MSNDWTSPGGDSHGPQQAAGPGAGQSPPRYGQRLPPQQPQAGQQYPPGGPAYGAPPYGQQYGGPPQPGPGGPGYGAPPPAYQLAPKPGVIPLRPLTLGDVFSGTFATIRGNPGATIGLSAVVALITAVPAVLIALALSGVDLSTTDKSGSSVNLIVQLTTMTTGLLNWIAGLFLTGMLTVVVAEAVLGRRMSIGEAWRKVRGRLLPLLGMTLLVGLVVVLVVAVVAGIAVLLALTVSTVLGVLFGVIVGIALLVGMVWFGVKISLAAPALVLERIGPVAALRRSFDLTKGQWWRIFGISVLAQLVVGMISSVVQLPVSTALAASASSDGTPNAGLLVATQLATVAVTALTAPFTSGVTALLYLDQRIRKEALDVTLMAAAGKEGAGGR